MPLVALVSALGYIFGRTQRSAGRAYGLTGFVALLGVVQMIWAVADGKGDDPGFLIAIGVVGGIVGLALARLGISHRIRKLVVA